MASFLYLNIIQMRLNVTIFKKGKLIYMYSYVYFITDGHGHIKIGKTDNVVKRLKELQTGNPYKLKSLLSIMMESPSKSFSLECALHKKFEKCRLEGEWFEEKPVLELINTDIVNIGHFKFGGLKYGN